MSQVTLSVSEETLLALRIAPEELGGELRLAAAVKLYEMGRLSSGSAAQLAGMPRALFLSKLGDYNVDTFRLTEAELEQDVERA